MAHHMFSNATRGGPLFAFFKFLQVKSQHNMNEFNKTK